MPQNESTSGSDALNKAMLEISNRKEFVSLLNIFNFKVQEYVVVLIADLKLIEETK
jgi:hypothetical protein